MRPRLTISQRQMVIVFAPLLFELAFVAVLASMLFEVDAIARRQSQSRAVVAAAHNLVHSLFEAGLVEVRWRFTWRTVKDKRMLKDVDSIVSAIPAQFTRLKTLTAGNPRQEPYISSMRPAVERIAYLLSYFRENVNNTDNIPMDQFAFGMSLGKNTTFLIAQLRALTDEEESYEAADERLADRDQAILKYCLLAGLVLPVVLAFGLAIFAGRTITKRLAVLEDNALRVASRLPLNQRVSGEDEIAKLDGVMHSMSNALLTAERQKQEVISMLSHDLRSPLTAIQGTLALLEAGAYGSLSEIGKERVANAEEGVVQSIEIINELLEVDRWESGNIELNRQSVDLCDLAQRAAAIMVGAAERKKMEIKLVNELLPVFADPDRLERVIVNLLSNAIKYSPEGTTISVSWCAQPDFAELTVSDQGRGISVAAQKRIFERYKQADSNDEIQSGSSGLGLAICKLIMEKHGGEIGVRSQINTGSEFFIRLPRQTPPAKN